MTSEVHIPRGSSNELGHPETIGETTVQVRSPRSTLKTLRVASCPPGVVRPIMEQRHYLGSMPGVVRECFAVHLADELVGGVVFTAGARHGHRILAGSSPGQVLTLSRFWMADGLPANNESRVLGIVLRELARGHTYKLVVSFADPAAGHVGTIYQATGFLYLGTTEPERYLIVAGKHVHPRSAFTRYGSNSPAHLRRTGVVAEVGKSPPKHRYVFLLEPSWRWRLRGTPRRYPKNTVRGPPLSALRINEMACRGCRPDRPRNDKSKGSVMNTSTRSPRGCQCDPRDRHRDYRTEYAQRIERGRRLGPEPQGSPGTSTAFARRP